MAKNPYSIDGLELLIPFGRGMRVHKNLYESTKNHGSIFDQHKDDIISATIKKGDKLSVSELKDIIGPDNWKWYRDDQFDEIYDRFVADNYDTLFGNEAKQNLMDSNVGLLMDAFGKYQPDTMNVDPTTGLSNQYQTYLDALNAASDQQYNIAMQELDVAENQMLRSIGLSQRQMERDIAKRRQQALKSGMSTAQLAAQEQQNILAAQTGATQIAQQYADQRYGMVNQFAGNAAQNYANVLGQQTESLVNSQNNSYSNLMSAWAQMYAADKYQP